MSFLKNAKDITASAKNSAAPATEAAAPAKEVETAAKAVAEATVGGRGLDEIAKEVIAGKWGVGQDRVKKLTDAGYDAAAVQKLVNQMMKK